MRIAVVGSGVAGLGAAYFLARTHDVTLFEADSRPGGHAHTVDHRNGAGAIVPIDTGFLVHSRQNYPNLVRLFTVLGVHTTETTMSFSVTCDRCGIEYSGARPWAQPANLVRPQVARLFGEIARFIRTAAAEVRPDQTLADFAVQSGYSRSFRDHFLLPLAAALWSTAIGETMNVPAAYAIGFMEHHGMLRFRRFAWRTVTGGSRTYVDAVIERLPNGIRLNMPVKGISRNADGVELHLGGDVRERFDHVVLATHPGDSLAMLGDASDDERAVLGAFTYSRNPTVLHTDTAYVPRRASARAAWNYRLESCADPSPRVTVTYDISRLQHLPGPERYLVTLNRGRAIAPDRIIREMTYAHPRYTFDSLAAQSRVHEIDGVRRTWFCGAWRGYGFHEDGLRSGLEVAQALGGGW